MVSAGLVFGHTTFFSLQVVPSLCIHTAFSLCTRKVRELWRVSLSPYKDMDSTGIGLHPYDPI